MASFRFQVLQMRESAAQEWLRVWAAIYERDSGYDETEYRALIGKHSAFSAEDFRRIGKWKDAAKTENQWRPNVAQVAYEIWERAAKELPQCPAESGVTAFLADWSERTYTDKFMSGERKKRFGLSRATTLLHFLSGARYPIFDSRVRTAVSRLRGRPKLPYNVGAYWDQLVPLFRQLSVVCGTEDFRMLDQALFSYGALEARYYLPSPGD